MNKLLLFGIVWIIFIIIMNQLWVEISIQALCIEKKNCTRLLFGFIKTPTEFPPNYNSSLTKTLPSWINPFHPNSLPSKIFNQDYKVLFWRFVDSYENFVINPVIKQWPKDFDPLKPFESTFEICFSLFKSSGLFILLTYQFFYINIRDFIVDVLTYYFIK